MKHLVLSCLLAIFVGTTSLYAQTNDRRDNAILLPSATSTSIVGNNTRATESGEEDIIFYRVDDVLFGNNLYNTLWYRWVAPTSGEAQFDVIAFYDCTLAVFQRDEDVYTGLDYDDDGGNGLNSRITLDVVAGETYYFAVGSWAGFRQGSFGLVISMSDVVSDSFADSNEYVGTQFTAVGNNGAFTAEGGEPDHGPSIRVSHKTAWIRWTAPQRSRVSVSTEGSFFDTILAVYRGDSVGNLTLVAQNDDVGSTTRYSELQFFADGGVTYHFVVDGAAGFGGRFSLAVSAVPAPPGLIMSTKEMIVYQGDFTSATVTVLGTGTYTYQWQRMAADTKDWVDISFDSADFGGVDGDTLFVFSASLDLNRDKFRVRVTDDIGTTTSAAVLLTVTEFPMVETEILGTVSINISEGGLPRGRDESELEEDEDPDKVVYFARGLPRGLKIDPETGVISGVVAGAARDYRVTYGVIINGKRSPVQFVLLFRVAAISPAFVGGFEALLTAPGEAPLPAAKVAFRVTNQGAFTGTVYSLADAKSYSFRGNLALDEGTRTAGGVGGAPIVVKRGKLAPYHLLFTINELDLNVSATLYDTVDAVVPAPVLIGETEEGRQLARFTGLSNAPWAGPYTTRLVNPVNLGDNVEQPLPGGSGFATVTIASGTGNMSVRGRLSEGTLFTANLRSSINAEYRIAQKLYRQPGGSLSGWVRLVDRGFDGTDYYVPIGSGSDLYWTKPENLRDKLYPAGFGPLALTWLMDPWDVPNGNFTELLGLNSEGEFTVKIDVGGITNPEDPEPVPNEEPVILNTRKLPIALSIDARNRVIVPAPNPTGFRLSVSTRTGAYSGSFMIEDTNPTTNRVVKRRVTFFGVLVQSPETYETGPFGQGFAILPPIDPKADTSITGTVDLLAGPPDLPFFKEEE